ncbi:cyclase family protein [Microlunatus sp. GCM10028923]|uniref:cyclase family protein n=1 Tax=Microlunatus sp. GCM10028923 TaxID=3273400 RepID=UPI00361672F6
MTLRLLDHAVIDCSMPIEEHWRFAPTITYREGTGKGGCAFHNTALAMSAHGFTHVDAPRHIDPDGGWLAEVPLQSIMGPAVIIDVSAAGDNAPIGTELLSGAEVREGDILLLRSDHERRWPTTTPEYWTRAPWLTRAAAEWVRAAGVSAIGYDFPQDRGIRADYVDDWTPAAELDDDWPCHRILLAAGIPQIEYLTNLAAIKVTRCTFAAVPLRVPRSDGAPVRALAFVPDEGD